MKAYGIFAALVVGLFGLSAWRGWQLVGSTRGFVPQSVREAPGGYRSFHYWRGGK
jgi:hypothetical protein